MAEASPVLCRVCASSNPHFVTTSDGRPLTVTESGWQLLRCEDCGFGSTHPTPTREDLNKAYLADYFTHDDFDLSRLPIHKRVRGYVYDGYYDSSSGLLQRAAGRVFHYLVNAIEPTHPRTFLDIGCGAGRDVALYLSSGWDATGLENDSQAVQLGVSKGLRIVQGSITDDDLPLPRGSFGAVQMRHSLEHFTDPRLALRRTKELLVPRGRLLVIVPNIASVDFGLFRTAWFHLNMPQHVSHFTRRSLVHLLEEEGFEVERAKGHFFIYNCFGESFAKLRAELVEQKVRMPGRLWVLAKVAVGFLILKMTYFVGYHLHLANEPRHYYALKVDARRPG